MGRAPRIVLTSREVAGLQKALESILTPISHSTAEEWGNAVMRDVRSLLGADQMLFALPLDGEIRIAGIGERTNDAARQYNDDYWRTDFVVSERRRALGLEVYHRDQLYRPGELRTDVLHNEWCVPNKLFDTLGMGVQVSQTTIPAGIHAYHSRKDAPEFGVRGQTLMQLLLPAFRSSVKSYAFLKAWTQSLYTLIDSIEEGICVVEADGSVSHRNHAFESMRKADVEWSTVDSAVLQTIKLLQTRFADGGTGRCADSVEFSRIVQTLTRRYEIRSVLTRDSSALPDALGLVTVHVMDDRASNRAKTMEIAREFNLTQRESEILVLLADRLHAKEIAQRIGVSVHTVRHHTEKIYLKMGVRSRGELAGLIGREQRQ